MKLPGQRHSLPCFFFVLSSFILRETETVLAGGGAVRGKERIPSRLCAVSAELGVRLEPTSREVMT